MADNVEIVGGVGITVGVDLSDLQGEFEQTVTIATEAGQKVASAWTAATDTSGTEALIQSLTGVGAAAEEAGSQIAAYAEQPQTLAEYYDQLEASALGASSSTTELGSAVNESAGSFADAGNIASELAANVTETGTAAEDAAGKLNEASAAAADLNTHVGESGHAASEAAGGFGEMGESLIALGEALAVTEGLKEFASEALSTYGAVQKATISLTALTHSAEQADRTIESLKALSITDALSFPQLVAADQRMTAFGISTEQIPELLQDAADAAGATGNSFERVSQALIRMSASGMASGRMLVQLGLTATDLGKVMGVTSDQVSKAFKEMDETERITALDTALQKFSGIAAEVAQSIPGEWQNVKTQFEFVMEDIGKALAPTALAIMSFARDTVIPAVKEMVDAFNSLPEPVRDTTVVVTGLIGVLTPLSLAIGGVMLAAGPLFAALSTGGPIILVLAGAIATAAGALETLKLGLEAITGATVSWKDTLLSAISAEHEYKLITGELDEQQKGLANDVKKATAVISEQSAVAKMAAAALAGITTGLHATASAHVIAGDMAAAHRVKIEQLSQALVTAKQHLHEITVEMTEGTKTAADLTKAYDEVTRIAGDLKAAYGQLSPEAKRLAEYHKLLAEHAQNFRLRLAELPAPIAAVSSETEVASAVALAHSQAISQDVAQVLRLGTALVQAQAALTAHRGSVEAVIKVENELAAAQARLNKLIGETPDIGATYNPTPPRELAAAIGSVVAELPKLPAFIPTLEQVDEEWVKQSSHVNKLAKYDLPAAIQAYTDYISKLEQVDAPLGQIYQAQEKLLQLEISYGAQTGQDSSAQIIALTKLKEKTEALANASAGIGTIYVGLMKTFDDAFNELETQLTAAITGTESWGKAMHAVVMKMASDIVSTLIHYALGQLKDAIVGVTSSAGGMGAAIGGAVKKLAGAAGGGAGGLTGGASGAAMHAAVTQFHTAVVQFQTADTQFHAGITQFHAAVTQMHTVIAQLQTATTQFQGGVTTFDAATSTYDAAVTTFDAAITTFDTSVGAEVPAIASFVGAVAAFTAAVGTFTTDVIMQGALGFFGFQGGGEVPGNVIGLLHAQEMVLPPHIAEGMRGLIAAGGTAAANNTTVNINSAAPISPAMEAPKVSITVPSAPPAAPLPSLAPSIPPQIAQPAPAPDLANTLRGLTLPTSSVSTNVPAQNVSVQPPLAAPISIPSVPDVRVPNISVPPIAAPPVNLPRIPAPEIPPVPKIAAPSVSIPPISLPSIPAPNVSVSAPRSLSLPSVPSAISAPSSPAPQANAATNTGSQVAFHNCQFSGVTQSLVDEVMNKAVKGTRRAGTRF